MINYTGPLSASTSSLILCISVLTLSKTHRHFLDSLGHTNDHIDFCPKLHHFWTCLQLCFPLILATSPRQEAEKTIKETPDYHRHIFQLQYLELWKGNDPEEKSK